MPQIGKDEFTRIRLLGGTGSYILAPVLTTTQRIALTAEEGMVIFNSTTDQLEEYDGSTWEAVGQVILTTHEAVLDAHTKNISEVLRTGEYAFPIPLADWSAFTLVASHLYAIPFLVARAMTVDRIATHVQTAGAFGKKARLGIYNNGTNLYPGTLLLDAGTIDVDGTGVLAVTISQALTKGIYWLAVVSDGTPALYSATPAYSPYGIRPADFNGSHGKWDVAQAYGTLPDPFTAGGSLTWGMPIIACRLLTLD